ncbi:glycosyltransferase family 4 protein [Zymomonas mobilis]|uniref:glycosyltransferase family 4 protein n=1 Tax=Zymomonas mobilis TaxID=542 RepID=UPI0003C75174|nr:glycosyltransferase family 1 protein [Zymomonas mobilis]AHB09436.1 glycosyltransferase [Zymomonas mobilis subsp. mobilis str. CP4 = NRRL B-14023]AHJ69742.1 D-inositol-3-phosphate glycosyltransferase [Zymomonas mobilis subsp. mobilis NRRL B-12526]AHJ71598.1 D-inositol-3-phosphate glycosyltransferase [Zymomonas mobilis subsp. mobilis str. CP4 = NRRL B-14023]TWE24301.1 glycosyltransferase involved in cell wall biosynthesis [Zymomonas mobilis]
MSYKIFVDGLNIALPHGTGIATYARSLLNTAKDSGHKTGVVYGRNVNNSENPRLREVLFFCEESSPPRVKKLLFTINKLLSQYKKNNLIPYKIPNNHFIDKGNLKKLTKNVDYIYNYSNLFNFSKTYYKSSNNFLNIDIEDKPEIMHWTHLIPIKSVGSINFYTIHDLVPFTHPYADRSDKVMNWNMILKIIENGDHILTVSEASRRDIIRLFNAPESQVTNLYQAVEFEEGLKNRPAHLVERDVNGLFGLEYGHYFLFYGAIEPKKNVKRLIEAYMAADCPGYPLVIVSSRSWSAEEDHALLEQLKGRELPGKKKIIQLDYMSRSQLVSVVKGARALVFPSIAEGFGLPVAEAMCLGTAVISSTHPAIQEIAGDAALLVDPYDVDALSAAISAMAEDDNLVKTLQQRGPVQAEKFSMENYKKRLKDFYKKFGF